MREGTAQSHASAVTSPPGTRMAAMAALLLGWGTLMNAMRRRAGEGQHDSD